MAGRSPAAGSIQYVFDINLQELRHWTRARRTVSSFCEHHKQVRLTTLLFPKNLFQVYPMPQILFNKRVPSTESGRVCDPVWTGVNWSKTRGSGSNKRRRCKYSLPPPDLLGVVFSRPFLGEIAGSARHLVPILLHLDIQTKQDTEQFDQSFRSQS